MKTKQIALMLGFGWSALALTESVADENSAGSNSSSVEQTDSDEQYIDEVMYLLEENFKANDHSYSIEMMYGPVMEAMGGKAALEEATEGILAQMESMDFELVSWTNHKPYHYFETSKRKYVIAPYTTVMSISGKVLEQKSYHLGIKIGEKEWRFLNGPSISKEVYEAFFPDIPAEEIEPYLEIQGGE